MNDPKRRSRFGRNLMTSVAASILLPAGVFAAGASTSSPSPAADEVAAIVSLLAPPANARMTAKGEPKELKLFDRLPKGSTIRLGEGARLAVVFVSGERFEASGPAELSVGARSLDGEVGRIRALRPVPVIPRVMAIAKSEQPSGRAGAVRLRGGGDPDAKRLVPSESEMVRADDVVLRFETGDDTRVDSKVELEDAQGRELLSLETRAAQVSVPKGVLKPGALYLWRVRSRLPNGLGPWSETTFLTLDSEQAAARDALASTIDDKDTSALLFLAELDRRMGLRRDACAGFNRAAAALEPAAVALLAESMTAAGCSNLR